MKTNRYTLIVIFLFLFISLTAQTSYKVLYNDGNVFMNDTLVLKGSLIKETDSISFKEGKGILKVCFSGCNKIKILAASTFNKTKSKTIYDYTNYYENLGTRADGNLNIIKLSDVLSIPKIAVIDTLNILFPTDEFEINKNKFFYIKYNYEGENFNKKLKVIDNNIIISKYVFTLNDLFFTPNGNAVSIYYYDELQKESILITSSFQPVFIDKSIVRNNLNYILDSNNLNEYEKLKLIEDFLKIEFQGVFFNDNNYLSILK